MSTILDTSDKLRMAVKLAVVLIVCFAGVFFGVLAGNAVLNRQLPPDYSGQTAASILAPAVWDYHQADLREAGDFPNFETGHTLPSIKVILSGGEESDLRSLTKGFDASIIFFLHLECKPCIDLLGLWRTRYSHQARADVNVVLCLAQEPGDFREMDEPLLVTDRVVFISEAYVRETFNITEYPSIVTVSAESIVDGIQVGAWEAGLGTEIVTSSIFLDN